jgi:hypothetical protein
MVFTLLVGTLGVTGSAHAQEPKWEVKTVEILGVKAHSKSHTVKKLRKNLYEMPRY